MQHNCSKLVACIASALALQLAQARVLKWADAAMRSLATVVRLRSLVQDAEEAGCGHAFTADHAFTDTCMPCIFC